MQEKETIAVCHDLPEVCEAVVRAASQLGYATRGIAAATLVEEVVADPSIVLIVCGMVTPESPASKMAFRCPRSKQATPC